MRKSSAIFLSLIVALMLACSWAEVRSFGNQASEAATSIAEDTGPLRATSSKLLETAVAGGQTQGPPLLTSIVSAVTQAANFEPGATTTLFGFPHENYSLVSGCGYASYDCFKTAPHTGVDSVPDPNAGVGNLPVPVLAAGPGKVERIQFMAAGCNSEKGDCGLGNTVILEHILADGSRIYSVYGHLDTISADLKVGECVQKGRQLGTMGRSGYGDREYWRARHLHLEFKTAPVLGDPASAEQYPDQMPEGHFFGYMVNTPDSNPNDWGFRNPSSYLNQAQARVCRN